MSSLLPYSYPPTRSHSNECRCCLLLLIAAVLSLAAPQPTAAQSPADSTVVEEDTERALETLDLEAADAEELAAFLADLAEDPLDINTATVEELALLPALTPFAARRIVAHRRAHGSFQSLSDLRNVEDLSEAALQKARAYLIVSEARDDEAEPPRYPAPLSFQAITQNLRFDAIQRLTRRLDLGRGYDDDTTRTTFLGSPERLYTRLRARHRRKVSLNLTLDKDPGEPFHWHPQSSTYGYDHVSVHAALRDLGRIKTLVLGDFAANFGQGLTLWKSSVFGKGREPVRTIMRSGRGIVPYGSTEENRFFRGLAGTFRLTPGLEVTAFASRRRLDASVENAVSTQSTEEGLANHATTLSQGGLHRTPSELRRKHALGETVVGAAVEHRGNWLHLGTAGYHSRFDLPLIPPDQLYQRYRFAGQTASALSAYASAFLGDFQLFGEAGRAPTGAFGGLGGLLMDLSRGAEAVVLARYFPRNFASLHGFAFGKRTGATENEMGLYTGLQFQPSRAWTVSAYFDQYRFPWARYGVPRPSVGHETRLVVEHRPRTWFTYYLQFRSEVQERGATVEDGYGRPLDGLRRETRQSARLHVDYTFSPKLRLRARLELSRYVHEETAPAEHGALLYQDVRWQPFRRIQIDSRLGFFDTQSYNARVYAYENDLLYAFSVPALFGQGRRSYVLLKLLPLKTLEFQLKYSITHFRNVDTIGSGLNETPGARLREIRAQVRWRL